MLTIIKPFQKTCARRTIFSYYTCRVLVLNPVLSISSPGFQKSSPGFVKHESGFFSSPGPGFSRVRIFLESESGSESESGPGFEVCPQGMTSSANKMHVFPVNLTVVLVKFIGQHIPPIFVPLYS